METEVVGKAEREGRAVTMTVTMSVLLQGRRVLSRGHGRWEGRWGSRLGSRCVLLREAGSQHAGPPGGPVLRR